MAPGACPDGRGDPGRAGDRPGVQVDGEAVLGEAALDRGRRLALDAVADPGVIQLPDELAGAVGGIAVDGLLAAARCGVRGGAARIARGSVLITGQQVSEQPGGGLGVPAVARGDPGSGDDLRVRIDRDMALVPVEAAGGGLVPVPGLRVHRGDHPVRQRPAGRSGTPRRRPPPGPGRSRSPAAPRPAPPPVPAPSRPALRAAPGHRGPAHLPAARAPPGPGNRRPACPPPRNHRRGAAPRAARWPAHPRPLSAARGPPSGPA